MVSFEVRRRPLTAGIVALAAAVTPCVGMSQPDSGVILDGEQQQIVATIQATQAQDGPYAIELLDPLKALGMLYRDSGDYALAAVALQRARQVVRANYGLSALEQAPLVRQQIINEEARGNVEGAWELEHELLALARRHADDLRTVPIFREVGDRRMAVLGRYLGGEFPPELGLGCYYDPNPLDNDGSCHAGSRGVVVRSLLGDAWRSYSAAIDVLLRNGLYTSDELRELDMMLVHSSYSHAVYGVGRRSLRRLLAYEVANEAPFLSQIDALIRLADWDLLFLQDRGIPFDLYVVTYRQMKASGTPQESIDRIFSPEIPIVLPTFLPNPLVNEASEKSTGYIDVTFELTKFGASRRVKIVGATANATDDTKDRLVTLISRSRFRPQLTQGQLARTAPILVRYPLDE